MTVLTVPFPGGTGSIPGRGLHSSRTCPARKWYGFVVGLTGGVGTGKSTVAGMFQRLGARALDADRIVHRLMEPGTAVTRRIRSRFGPGVLTPAGRVRRRRLGQRVFASRRELEALNRIVHPAVRREIQAALRRIRRADPAAAVVLDVPLLLESGPAYRTDAVVVVSAPAGVVARRLKARSGWGRREMERRSAFQMPLSEKERRADFVVNNGGSRSATRRQVVEIWKTIRRGSRWRKKR